MVGAVPNLQFDQDTVQRMQAAKAAGWDDVSIMQKAAEFHGRKNPAAKPKTMTDRAIDFLPLIGGLAGSFIPGAGTIVGGALGAGGATLLKQMLKNERVDLKDVAKEAAFAGAGGALGKGLGFVGGKLLGKGAGAAGDLGEQLAAKAFRINPGQAAKFEMEAGEQFGKFLTKRGITNPNLLDDAVRAIQQPFDEIVESSNLLVKPESLFEKAAQKIAELNKSAVPGSEQKAKLVQDSVLKIMEQYGNQPIPAKVLTGLRREFDESITKFAMDEGLKGPSTIVRDLLQGTLRDTADEAGLKVGGRSLKEAGVELSKLYKAQEIATRQSNLGTGSAPLGILKLLGGAAGGATGGPGGAIGGMAATEAINNPANLGMLSKMFTGASKGLERLPQMSAGATDNLARGGMAAGSLIGMAPEQAQASTGEMGGMGGMAAPGGMPSPADFGISPMSAGAAPGMGGGGQEDQMRQAIGALMFSKAKTTSDMAKAYEFMFPSTKPGKAKSASGLQVEGKAKAGLAALDTIQSELQSNPGITLQYRIPGSPGARQYAAAVSSLTDAIGGLRTGASVSKEQQKFYEEMLPKFGDSPDTIQYKIDAVRSELMGYSGGAGNISDPQLDMVAFYPQE